MPVVQPTIATPNYHYRYYMDALANNLAGIAGAGGNLMHGFSSLQQANNQRQGVMSQLGQWAANYSHSSPDLQPILTLMGINGPQAQQFLQQWANTRANMGGEAARSVIAQQNAMSNNLEPYLNLPTGGYNFPNYQNASPPAMPHEAQQTTQWGVNPQQWFSGGSQPVRGPFAPQSNTPGPYNAAGALASALIPYYT